LWAQRLSFKEINVLMPEVPTTTLYSWVRALKKNGNLDTFKGSKRPPKYTERDKRALKVAAVRNPNESVAGLAEIACFDGNHKTVVRYLKKEGLQSVVKAKVPQLTASHIEMRLKFVDLHFGKGVDYWKTWTFSDESSFHLDCAKGISRVIIRKNERYLLKNVQGTRQQGGGKLMVWSHVSWEGIGPLIFIYGGIDARLYKEILQQTVLPHLLRRRELTNLPQRYMDDGATCHDSHLSNDYCWQVGIDRPFWPANSPDMNPIEHVWGWVNNKLSALPVKPHRLEDLETILKEMWEEITVESVRNLYRGMPRRLEELRRVKGHNTSF
jgi:transposase